jgi:hypothetical protein
MSYSALLIGTLVMAAAIMLFMPLGVARKGSSSGTDETAKPGGRRDDQRGDLKTRDVDRRRDR